MIRFESVTKTYPRSRAPVLNDFSLEVPHGSFCVLLGRSGAGKSTALKLVNRLQEPTSGRVLVNGSDVSAQDPYALRRSM
jgi:osmoprotectant transport system ATP-binding protein